MRLSFDSCRWEATGRTTRPIARVEPDSNTKLPARYLDPADVPPRGLRLGKRHVQHAVAIGRLGLVGVYLARQRDRPIERSVAALVAIGRTLFLVLAALLTPQRQRVLRQRELEVLSNARDGDRRHPRDVADSPPVSDPGRTRPSASAGARGHGRCPASRAPPPHRAQRAAQAACSAPKPRFPFAPEITRLLSEPETIEIVPRPAIRECP
jgi:hypothetical protein